MADEKISGRIALLDVDETLLFEKGQGKPNEEIIAFLKQNNIREIYLFTSYGPQAASSRTHPAERKKLVEELKKRGFDVKGVITQMDPYYQKGLGAWYIDKLRPLELLAEDDSKSQKELTEATNKALSQEAFVKANVNIPEEIKNQFETLDDKLEALIANYKKNGNEIDAGFLEQLKSMTNEDIQNYRRNNPINWPKGGKEEMFGYAVQILGANKKYLFIDDSQACLNDAKKAKIKIENETSNCKIDLITIQADKAKKAEGYNEEYKKQSGESIEISQGNYEDNENKASILESINENIEKIKNYLSDLKEKLPEINVNREGIKKVFLKVKNIDLRESLIEAASKIIVPIPVKGAVDLVKFINKKLDENTLTKENFIKKLNSLGSEFRSVFHKVMDNLPKFDFKNHNEAESKGENQRQDNEKQNNQLKLNK